MNESTSTPAFEIADVVRFTADALEQWRTLNDGPDPDWTRERLVILDVEPRTQSTRYLCRPEEDRLDVEAHPGLWLYEWQIEPAETPPSIAQHTRGEEAEDAAILDFLDEPGPVLAKIRGIGNERTRHVIVWAGSAFHVGRVNLDSSEWWPSIKCTDWPSAVRWLTENVLDEYSIASCTE